VVIDPGLFGRTQLWYISTRNATAANPINNPTMVASRKRLSTRQPRQRAVSGVGHNNTCSVRAKATGSMTRRGTGRPTTRSISKETKRRPRIIRRIILVGWIANEGPSLGACGESLIRRAVVEMLSSESVEGRGGLAGTRW
jgi:hypothetical protein